MICGLYSKCPSVNGGCKFFIGIKNGNKKIKSVLNPMRDSRHDKLFVIF